MVIKKKTLGFYLVFLLSIIYTLLAVYVINNPDLSAYTSLVKNYSGFTLNIEPILGLFTIIARFITQIINLESTTIVYFLYIFLGQLYLYKGLSNILNDSKLTILSLVAWFLSYGTMHSLIQIRFGLANCLFLFSFSLLFVKSSTLKLNIYAVVTFFSHYSSILGIISIYLEKFKKRFLQINTHIAFHLIIIAFSLLLNSRYIISLLPDFIFARTANYLVEEDAAVSQGAIIISFIIYILLVFTKKVSAKIDSLRLYGAAGFIPYFMISDLAIFIRLGIPLQYLLLPYLVLTFKIKKLMYTSTIPLTLFFLYKIYSNYSAFLGYI